MDAQNMSHSTKLIKKSYIELGYNSLQKRVKILKQILTQRQLPEQGLDQLTINYIMDELAIMDSNNFYDKIGVGERQARIFSKLVIRRNFYMGHGMGRSGDLMADQPKAAGSSLLVQLCRFLTVSALKELHYDFVKDVLLLPMATGMALTMVFLTLAEIKPTKKYVLWPRIDQKTCLKSISTANLIPIVIEETLKQDALTCSHQQIQAKIQELGPQNILCIVSTTSCFAPRIPDDVHINSLIAKKFGLYHVVNNAYGLWCTKIAHMIREGITKGQCTAVVQSMDKNFMVPVGGAIVFAQREEILSAISGKYPGRATSSPIVDLFLTLLQMGKSTLHSLKTSRKQTYSYMLKKSVQFAQKNYFRILKTDQNTISIAMQLTSLSQKITDITELGAILYSKRVMGHRILVQKIQLTSICGCKFRNYGTHCQGYPFLPYVTFACAVGTEREEVDVFFQRLDAAIKELLKKNHKKNKGKEKEKEKEKITNQEKDKITNQEKDKITNQEKDKITNQEKDKITNQEKDKITNQEKDEKIEEIEHPQHKPQQIPIQPHSHSPSPSPPPTQPPSNPQHPNQHSPI